MNRIKWAIEDSFPIVEINRLAVPERNSFKPIYQMHKWFARRASCVFRAILLGCLKPIPVDKDGKPIKSGAEIIMEEFYRDHTHDPDTNGKVILDPFMGGGTTVVEALRLGCNVIGIDLNPVAWIIVKTEVEPVDVDQLKRSFEELGNRIVPWSGEPLKHTLRDLYKTTCPCCGNQDADIIYTFWVKSAICTNPTCRKPVPLFSDYIVTSKQPSVRYHQDVTCPNCSNTFDWETEPASLIAESSLTVVNKLDGAGVGRGNKRWAFSTCEPVTCPWCSEPITPKLGRRSVKPLRKKVPLAALLCPHCLTVWQYRGSVEEPVACPSCKTSYEASAGNAVRGGKYVCPACGTADSVSNSVRALPSDQVLPFADFAIQGFCAICGRSSAYPDEDDLEMGLAGLLVPRIRPFSHEADHRCNLTRNKGKFFKRIEPQDKELFQRAARDWQRHRASLPHPRVGVRVGDKTKSGLLLHHYDAWSKLYNARQLISLATLLEAIGSIPDKAIRDGLLGPFQLLVDRNNMFSRFHPERDTVEGCFGRHDFQPKNMPVEVNTYGSAVVRGSWVDLVQRAIAGKQFQTSVYDRRRKGRSTETVASGESVLSGSSQVLCGDARDVLASGKYQADHIITDPPYGGNVNYAELSDLFYSWLREVLKTENPVFAPEDTPKSREIVENRTRGITLQDYQEGLREVLAASARSLSAAGLCCFTFHHAETKTWEALVNAVLEAGLDIVAAYPVHAEHETSMHLRESTAIGYDLVCVCKKRLEGSGRDPRSWAGVRRDIRQRARKEIEAIESGCYGNEPLSPADVNIVLIGKCLELYSQHYGHVVDHDNRNVPLHEALEVIRMEVDQLVSQEQPLPSELADIDPVSYVYLVCLADRAVEIKSDELHKYTRGVLEPEELIDAGLIIKGRAGRGRHFKVKSPDERFTDLQEKFRLGGGATQAALPGLEDVVNVAGSRQRGVYFIDYVHYLIGLVEGGENLRPWLERFRGLTPQLRAACEYLRRRQPRFASPCDKILKFLEVSPLFKGAGGS